MIRRSLKYLFYNVLCPALLFLSADKFLSAMSGNKRLIIMYHGVRKGKQRINGRHITAGEFERQLRYFSRHFAVVPLPEICEMKIRGIVPVRRTIALTFDDGFLNNVTVALPLLRKYGMPATFFLCTAAIEDTSYLHPSDLLDLARVAGGTDEISIAGDTFARQGHQLRSIATGRNAYEQVSSLPLDRWHSVMNTLKGKFEVNKLTADVNKELYALIDDTSIDQFVNDDLAGIGSHSHHHVDLTQLQEEEIFRELESSKKILGAHTAKPVESVAFPYGYYNATVIRQARALGFRYLIAGGDVPPEFSNEVFPRIGVLDGAGFGYAILSVRWGFGRFGF